MDVDWSRTATAIALGIWALLGIPSAQAETHRATDSPTLAIPDAPPRHELRLVQTPPEPPLVETAPELPERSVRDVSIAIGTPGEEVPADVAAQKFNRLPLVLEAPGWQRPWLASEFFWTAPAVGYRPLYFEDANLERYGHSFGVLQPAVSAGRGFGQFLALPYQMTLQPPREIVYPLGYARPGDRVMYQAERLEWDARAAAVEAGVVTGFIFLIP